MKMPAGQLSLFTQRLCLRSYTLDDVPHMVELISDPDVTKYTLIPRPFTRSMARDWIASRHVKYARGESVHYAVAQNNMLIGGIGLQIDAKPNKAELNYWFGKEFWNKGLATEAVQRMVQYAFDELGLHRIQATHSAGNPASGRVLQKAGFQYEGLMKEASTSRSQDKKYDDLAFYGIVQKENTPA